MGEIREIGGKWTAKTWAYSDERGTTKSVIVAYDAIHSGYKDLWRKRNANLKLERRDLSALTACKSIVFKLKSSLEINITIFLSILGFPFHSVTHLGTTVNNVTRYSESVTKCSGFTMSFRLRISKLPLPSKMEREMIGKKL